jgi:predicted transcriptional regulator
MPYKFAELSDSEVIEKLNDTWQTVGQVHSKFGRRMAAVFIAAALKRIAEKGLIERRAEGTGVQKRRGRGRFGEFSIDLYRRLPNHQDAQN